MNHSLTDWRRVVCGGGRTAQNARRTCAVRVAQSGGGGHFREKSALEAAFSASHAILDYGWRRRAAAPSFRAFQQRRNAPAILQGQIFRQKFRLAILQGQIFRQKFRPAVCRDKFSTQIISLRSAGMEFWRRNAPISTKTLKKGQKHAST